MGKYIDKLIFGDWFVGKKKLVNISDNENSRKRLHGKKQYDITIGENQEYPFCFLKIGTSRIFVGFLNINKQMYLSYDWYREENGKLFLNDVTYYEYMINSLGDEEISKQTKYIFQINGDFKIITYDNVKNEKETLTAQEPLSSKIVEHLWVDYPAFGQYDELIKLDRIPSEVFGK